ncbi:MAG: 30S ribosomal protein S4e [Candidatus Diapherotrites archaeon]|nr:30S ribosomal protein S4e [Candidatus Diapherotrites archaeon]
MAKKGQSKALKRYNVPRVMRISPKEGKFAIKTQAGPHSKERSVPLGYLLRDVIKVAETMREVKFILARRKVRVNGVVRTSHKFPVGLFDVVSVEGLENDYKIVYDHKGRFTVEKIEPETKIIRPSKVVNKVTVKGGKIQLTTDDGRNILTDDNSIRVHDTIMLELPEQRVVKVIKMQSGAKAYIIGGSHIAQQATIKEIKPGTEKKPRMVILKRDAKEFETTIDNVMVIGEQ